MKQMEEFKQLCEQHGIEPEKVNAFFNAMEKKMKNKRYGLVWEEQEEDIEKTLKDRYTVLHEVTEREIKLDEGGRTHSLIEGDNLEALTFLKNSGKKVDVIYIDPPYNTLNRDFIYNDHYVDKEDAWRHSKWLSFMNKRLVLARELMTDDGVIFISIDDHEMAQLKLLCDAIFGEKNFVSNLIWKKSNGKNDSKHVRTLSEYVLIYTKSSSLKEFNNVPLSEETAGNYRNSDNDSRGRWTSLQLYKDKNPTKYDVVSPTGKVWRKGWNYNEEGWKELEKNKLIYWGKDGNAMPRKKIFLKDNKGTKISNLILDCLGNNAELLNIMGEKAFSYPKPVLLIKKILQLHPNPNTTILDFFAGSGTTAHAVLELNREDGGNRQVIVCTNNENNIAEEVTYERIKRVMEGYSTPKGKSVEGIPGNLRYFKVDSVDANEDIYTLEDNLLEVVVPFIQFQEDAWAITTGKPGFTYLDDRVTIYNDPYHLDEDFLDHIKGDTFYIYDGWMDYLDIEELKNIRVVPIPKEFFKLFR